MRTLTHCSRVSFVAACLALLGFPGLAKADTFLYTVNDLVFGSTATFEESTLASSGDITSFLSTTGRPIQEFVWNSPALPPAVCKSSDGSSGSNPDGACSLTAFGSPLTVQTSFFVLGSFLSPGTYQGFGGIGNLTETVTITEISGVPEPGSVVLLGVGLLGLAGIAGIKRRRRFVA